MALQQMEENPMSYVVGNGFGSLVDLGFKAPIGGEDGLRYIPHFHNGYVYVFYKTGLIGILFYLIIIFNLYKRGYVKTKTKYAKTMNRLISGFGIYFFVTTLVITGMYNLQEISVFLVGCLFALSFQFEKRNYQIAQ
jgi:O-antigen ligase